MVYSSFRALKMEKNIPYTFLRMKRSLEQEDEIFHLTGIDEVLWEDTQRVGSECIFYSNVLADTQYASVINLIEKDEWKNRTWMSPVRDERFTRNEAKKMGISDR